jgi:hypothetical protein
MGQTQKIGDYSYSSGFIHLARSRSPFFCVSRSRLPSYSMHVRLLSPGAILRDTQVAAIKARFSLPHSLPRPFRSFNVNFFKLDSI